MPPAGSFAGIGQTGRPETVELQLLIELAGEPARSPLPRPMQLHGPEPDLHAMALGVFGQRPIGGEQRQLGRLLRILVENFDHPAPGLLLAVVDLAEIEHLPLHHLAAGAALALDNAPVAVLLAVFEASIRAQIHGDPNLRQTGLLKRYLVSTTRGFQSPVIEPIRFFLSPRPEVRRQPAPVEKVGLTRGRNPVKCFELRRPLNAALNRRRREPAPGWSGRLDADFRNPPGARPIGVSLRPGGAGRAAALGEVR